MIELAWRTPAGWAADVSSDPLALLSDHAHCELQAATAVQAIVTRNAEYAALVDPLAGMATEELRHFRRVVRALRRRGGELRAAQPNPYTAALLERSGPTRGAVLLDKLLVAGLIETRSHERFTLLAEGAGDEELRGLYRRLCPSEEAHGALFHSLAMALFDARTVARRASELAALEGEVAREQAFDHRIHAGAR